MHLEKIQLISEIESPAVNLLFIGILNILRALLIDGLLSRLFICQSVHFYRY